jgi:hypothetical protein
MLLGLLLLLATQGDSADEYIFSNAGNEIAVTISGSWRETACEVTFATEGRTNTQKLSPSSGSFFLNRRDWEDSNWSRPSAGVVWNDKRPVIWCLESDLTGVYEYAEIRFWSRSGSAWISLDSDDLSFSNRGGFYFEGNKLRLFDFVYDTHRAHWDSHTYSLKEYAVEPDSVRLESSRKTKRRYSPEGDSGYPVPEFVEPKNDPLREFGLEWKWWGPRPERDVSTLECSNANKSSVGKAGRVAAPE